MPDPTDNAAEQTRLARELGRLQQAHPELDALSALVLLALRDAAPAAKGVSSAQLARHLTIEHALIRRAGATLEEAGLITTAPAGGASPALRLHLQGPGMN